MLPCELQLHEEKPKHAAVPQQNGVTKNRGTRKFPSHQNVHKQEHGPYNLHSQQNHQF
jgi:hypothetical protein